MVKLVRRSSDGDDTGSWQGTPEGFQALETDPERRAWAFIGDRLYQGRKKFQISKREAARRAGISEALCATRRRRRDGQARTISSQSKAGKSCRCGTSG